MKIGIGSDHAGFRYKEIIRAHLAKAGHEVVDFGTYNPDRVDYPKYIRPVAQAVAMADSLKSHGKDVETVIVPGATHFFTEQQNATARRRLFDFLRRHLNRS